MIHPFFYFSECHVAVEMMSGVTHPPLAHTTTPEPRTCEPRACETIPYETITYEPETPKDDRGP